jgi:hypothetical protein
MFKGELMPAQPVKARPSPELLGPAAARVAQAFAASVAKRQIFDEPYRHFLLEDCLPKDVADDLGSLPFAAPVLDGVSGKRELHNDQRSYFDAAAMARFPVMRAVAEALQSRQIASLIHETFGASIDDTFLRLEYAQDIDGFWLEPHTDLGVKKFTCLIYLSEGPGHETLGTDIYASRERHFGTPPFKRGGAMVFVPGDNTWHGFEKRPIEGVRRSVILNYVTHEWRAREQLSYPDATVRV